MKLRLYGPNGEGTISVASMQSVQFLDGWVRIATLEGTVIYISPHFYSRIELVKEDK